MITSWGLVRLVLIGSEIVRMSSMHQLGTVMYPKRYTTRLTTGDLGGYVRVGGVGVVCLCVLCVELSVVEILRT